MRKLKNFPVPKWAKNLLNGRRQILQDIGIIFRTGILEEILVKYDFDNWLDGIINKGRSLMFNPPHGITKSDDDAKNIKLYITNDAQKVLEKAQKMIKSATGMTFSYSQLFIDKLIYHYHALRNLRINLSKKRRARKSSKSTSNS